MGIRYRGLRGVGGKKMINKDDDEIEIKEDRKGKSYFFFFKEVCGFFFSDWLYTFLYFFLGIMEFFSLKSLAL